MTTETSTFSSTPPEPSRVVAEGFSIYGCNEYTAPTWSNGDDVDLARCPSCGDAGDDVEADACGRFICQHHGDF